MKSFVKQLCRMVHFHPRVDFDPLRLTQSKTREVRKLCFQSVFCWQLLIITWVFICCLCFWSRITAISRHPNDAIEHILQTNDLSPESSTLVDVSKPKEDLSGYSCFTNGNQIAPEALSAKGVGRCVDEQPPRGCPNPISGLSSPDGVSVI